MEQASNHTPGGCTGYRLGFENRPPGYYDAANPGFRALLREARTDELQDILPIGNAGPLHHLAMAHVMERLANALCRPYGEGAKTAARCAGSHTGRHSLLEA